MPLFHGHGADGKENMSQGLKPILGSSLMSGLKSGPISGTKAKTTASESNTNLARTINIGILHDSQNYRIA
jgi:hypothetical protein